MATGYGGDTNMQASSATPAQRKPKKVTKPKLEKTKGIKYSATASDLIFSVSETASSSVVEEGIPDRVEIENTGRVPLMIMAGYETYTNDTTDDGLEYLHTMVMPGQVYTPPLRGVIQASNTIIDGTVADNAVPDANLYTDSSANTDDTTATNNIDNSDSNTLAYLEPYTDANNCTANLFFVGDLIRIRDEIMEVTAIGDKSDLANNTLTVTRAEYGSAATSNTDDGDAVRLPFFNMYHQFNDTKPNGSGDGQSSAATLVKTDGDGKFKAMNFFGLGRSATTGQSGLTPGSIALKFYTVDGYLRAGLGGITASTHSGLAASTTYKFNMTVDGGAAVTNISFTTDASNLNFGGKNGILSKIQSAINAKYYVAGGLFEKVVHVSIVDGDIRFTSGSNMAHSAVTIADPSSGTTPWGVGRLPAASTWISAAAKLPDDVVYDKLTHTSTPNISEFLYDDGYGNLIGNGNGTISYETGEIEFKNAPRNAQFVYSVSHTSAFSGKLVGGENGERTNTLIKVLANTPCQKCSGQVKVRTY